MIMLDFELCDAARLRRDPAYDGRFFIAVRTTRIYCRPVCKVRQPLSRNIAFFVCAAAAEHRGCRPCLRCRPEAAPFCPAWPGADTILARALRLLEAGALDHGSVAELCTQLDIERAQLLRLFAHHLQASPVQVARTLRTHRAKRLLNNTTLAMTDVAKQAGFPSVRSFNAAMTALYRRAPLALRRTI